MGEPRERIAIDFDTISERAAKRILQTVSDENPQLVGIVVDSALWASPLAGPIRLLREVECAMPERFEVKGR